MLDFNKMGWTELKSLEKVLNVLTNKEGIEISEEFGDINRAVGFNEKSGYVYAVLDNGIILCSAFGNDAEYLVTNYNNGEEFFFDTLEEALEKQNEINSLID